MPRIVHRLSSSFAIEFLFGKYPFCSNPASFKKHFHSSIVISRQRGYESIWFVCTESIPLVPGAPISELDWCFSSRYSVLQRIRIIAKTSLLCSPLLFSARVGSRSTGGSGRPRLNLGSNGKLWRGGVNALAARTSGEWAQGAGRRAHPHPTRYTSVADLRAQGRAQHPLDG